jgi:hypothetical protein
MKQEALSELQEGKEAIPNKETNISLLKLLSQ